MRRPWHECRAFDCRPRFTSASRRACSTGTAPQPRGACRLRSDGDGATNRYRCRTSSGPPPRMAWAPASTDSVACRTCAPGTARRPRRHRRARAATPSTRTERPSLRPIADATLGRDATILRSGASPEEHTCAVVPSVGEAACSWSPTGGGIRREAGSPTGCVAGARLPRGSTRRTEFLSRSADSSSPVSPSMHDAATSDHEVSRRSHVPRCGCLGARPQLPTTHDHDIAAIGAWSAS
jgi:hypothetical protein